MNMDTPIFDQLIRDRGGRRPGQLTEQDLKELANYQAALVLPPALTVDVEGPAESSEEPVPPLSQVEAPTPPAPAVEEEQETTQTIQVRALRDKETEGESGDETQTMPLPPNPSEETQELPAPKKKAVA